MAASHRLIVSEIHVLGGKPAVECVNRVPFSPFTLSVVDTDGKGFTVPKELSMDGLNVAMEFEFF